jgi:hypothetical protein
VSEGRKEGKGKKKENLRFGSTLAQLFWGKSHRRSKVKLLDRKKSRGKENKREKEWNTRLKN